MKEFNGLILAHYDFDGKDGKHVNTTKIRVSMGEFGSFDICSELANEKEILSLVKVQLSYDGRKFKVENVK